MPESNERTDAILFMFYRSKAYDSACSSELRQFASLWMHTCSPKFKERLRGAAIRIRDDYISDHKR